MASDEVDELARTVTELTAQVRKHGAQATHTSEVLDRLSGSLSQVALLIEDLQERVAYLEEQADSVNHQAARTQDRA